MPGIPLKRSAEAAEMDASKSTTAKPPDLYLIAAEDAIYEQDILRNPSSIRPWLTYIDHKMRNGTLYEQGICSRARVHPFASIVQTVEDVPGFSNKALAQEKSSQAPGGIPQGQCIVRESSRSLEQDAHDLGDVLVFPPETAFGDFHEEDF